MIQAEATTPIPTGVVFWSHDKGTAKLIIQLKKDHINQTLPQGTIVPILLEFNSATAANGRGRHIYHAVIENALEGIVSIVLEDNILGYVGRVDGSVYIELPDSRSLDTAGRFTFDIKRSPIDDDVPELEDYYWQGFSEIVEESKRLINQIESDCKVVLDNLNSKVTVLETQTTDIKNKQAEIIKSIEEHDVFTKEESSANVIYQIIGKDEVEMTFTFDLRNKIAGSYVENPNSASFRAGPTLLLPSSFTADSYINYPTLYTLDGTLTRVSNSTAGNMAQICVLIDVLEELKRELSEEFFVDRGATTDEEKASVIESIITEFTSNFHGYGVSPQGNKLTHRNWYGMWTVGESSTSNQISRIGRTLKKSDSNWKKLINGGKIPILISAEASDGVAASSINLDYANLEVKVRLSMNEHIKLMMAHNHIKNIATEEEAEAGENNEKTMTPLRVFQAIAKWTKDKFVSRTENETVLGVKNFENGLQVGGKNVLSQEGEIIFDHTSETDSSIQSGIVRFKRYGDLVLVNFNFQCRSTNIASGGNLIGVLEADIIPSGSIQVDITYDKALTIDASGKVTALWGLDANKYYAGSTMYFAKNKL